MMEHFLKKLLKLGTKKVVVEQIKIEKQEETPMTPTVLPKKAISELSLSISASTNSLSTMVDDMSSSMVFEGDVWLLEGP